MGGAGCNTDGFCTRQQQRYLADIADPAVAAPAWGEDEEHGSLGISLHLLAGGLVDEAHSTVAPFAIGIAVTGDVSNFAGTLAGVPFCAGVLGDQHNGANAFSLVLNDLLHPGANVGVGRVEPGPGSPY